MNAPVPERMRSLRPPMTFIEHLIELRERIIKALIAVGVAMVISFFFVEPTAFEWALKPLAGRELLFLGIADAFTIHMTFALYLGFILALPVVAYQAWAFVSPGLYPNERAIAVKLASVSTLLFLAGAAFGYFLLMPVAVKFFLSFEAPNLNLRYGGALDPYLQLFAGILIGAGLCFQMPLIMIGLMKAGILSAKTAAEQRGYWILAIAILAAVLTPTGDMMTQCLLGVPMWLLFESAIIYARIARI